MEYSKRSRDPSRHFVGLSFVFLLHALVVYALVTGLAQKVVEIVKAPIETKVIEEIRKPPPPPENAAPPPPRIEAPPPPFIPPPEVQVQTPPAMQPTITATQTAPTEPMAMTPMAPQAPVESPPAPVSAAVVCSNYASVMGDAGFPRDAQRQGLDRGDALIQFTLGANGEVKDVRALRASHPSFARNSIRIVGEYRCQGQGREVVVQVPFRYKLE